MGWSSIAVNTFGTRPVTRDSIAFVLNHMSDTSIHEVARTLPVKLGNFGLHILDAKAKFVSRRTNDDQEWPTGEHAPDGKAPATLSASVKFQMVRLSLNFL
jgi:4-hydroxyphenylpyruvate dioxygenase-like putative hemolysin